MTGLSQAQTPAPSLKMSAKTLDDYAAAAGRKYMNVTQRIKQKIKSVPALDKVVTKVKAWDQKMLQEHGAAYKFAKGAVIGAAIGVGLAAAGAEVVTAYAAVNAVRAAGSLLSEAEKARQEGHVSGFTDFAAKNKGAVALAAVSVGLSATGVAAGVVENQVASTVLSAGRSVAVGGMMAGTTAKKIHAINAELKAGKITEEQAKQAKKEEFAELGGNLAGLAVVGLTSSANQNQPAEAPAQQTVADNTVYNGGTLPEAVVTAPAPAPTPVPDNTVYNGGTLPEVVVTAPAPAPVTAPAPETVPLPPLDMSPVQPLQPLPDIKAPPLTMPEIHIPSPVDKTPVFVERNVFSSFSQQVTPTEHTVSLDLSDIRQANDMNETSLFAYVQDIEGSEAKLMAIEVNDNGKIHSSAELYIDKDGTVKQLPEWHAFPDVNGDCQLSEQEIKDWSTKRQASLQSVLSEQEAKTLAMSELKNEAKLYDGTDVRSVKADQASGMMSYEGPLSGLKDAGEAPKIAHQDAMGYADKVANSAKDMMCNRVDAQGNACQVKATDAQIRVADVLLRSAAAKFR